MLSRDIFHVLARNAGTSQTNCLHTTLGFIGLQGEL